MYYYFDIDNIWARIRQYVSHADLLIHKTIVILEYYIENIEKKKLTLISDYYF